jgi:hypothetical protein
MGIVWSSWAGAWICLMKNWHPLQDLTMCVMSLVAVDSKKLVGKPSQPCFLTKHYVHRPPLEYREVVPYLLQWGHTIEGCLRHYSDIAYCCGLGTPWFGALGFGSRFCCLVLLRCQGQLC